ncbi:MAG: type IV pilus assembly protein PilM [Candidatus Omnitrophica bacterium]|nr:type IV pilus assembly protein PilM [Candidatus Omnitrophota bacterium]MDD5238694.1 type IV pilus assembly protein PilM [Candidatus Omnitrophota bacterium]
MAKFLKAKEKFKERISVGLDMGTNAIKIVKLRFFKEGTELSAFEIEPSQLDVASALKRLKNSLGEIDGVNLSASGSSTVIRYVEFPRMSSEELKQSLKFEAQKHIPFSIGEVNLDGNILKPDLPDNKMLVLVAAAKKELVKQRLKLIEDAGMKPNLIDIDSIALMNAFNFNYAQDETLQHKTVALLNIGGAVTNLDIMEDGIPRLSRDIHIAGNNITNKIKDIFAVDFGTAENLKLNPTSEKANKVTVALESVLTNLAAEIRTSFDYYESQSASSVAKIFLSGGTSKFNGLKEILTNFLGIEVEHWDPLKQISLPGKLDAQKVKASSGQLAVAVGLALR